MAFYDKTPISLHNLFIVPDQYHIWYNSYNYFTINMNLERHLQYFTIFSPEVSAVYMYHSYNIEQRTLV